MQHPELTADHRRAIVKEAFISAGVSGLGPTAVIHLLGVAPPSAVWAPGGVGPSTLLATFFCTLLMTLILTAVIRRRVASGALPPLASGGSWLRHMPRRVLPRALLLTLAMLAVAPAATIAIVSSLSLLPMSGSAFVAFNVLFGGMLGFVAGPLIVLAALADPVPSGQVLAPSR